MNADAPYVLAKRKQKQRLSTSNPMCSRCPMWLKKKKPRHSSSELSYFIPWCYQPKMAFTMSFPFAYSSKPISRKNPMYWATSMTRCAGSRPVIIS